MAKAKPAPPAKKRKTETARPAPKAHDAGDGLGETVKGKMIQKLQCRWWYAIEWPAKEDVEKALPYGYEMLDGYPGVSICTKGDDIGKMLDRRNHRTSPCFKNLKAKDCEELKELLIRALEGQQEELIEHEGEGTTIGKEVVAMLKWARKVNASKADKEARRYS